MRLPWEPELPVTVNPKQASRRNGVKKQIRAVIADNRRRNAGKPRHCHRMTSPAKIRKSMQREAMALIRQNLSA